MKKIETKDVNYFCIYTDKVLLLFWSWWPRIIVQHSVISAESTASCNRNPLVSKSSNKKISCMSATLSAISIGKLTDMTVSRPS